MRAFLRRCWRVVSSSPRRRFLASIFAIFIATLVAIYVIVEPAETITMLEAKSGQVTFDVRNPAMAAFATRCMQVAEKTDAGMSVRTIEGVFTPRNGSRISYTAALDDHDVGSTGERSAGNTILVIQVAPPAGSRAGQENAGPANSLKPFGADSSIALGDRLFFTPAPGCKSPHAEPLPIWGGLEVGEEPSAISGDRPAPHYLREGRLSVYAKAQTIMLPLKWLLGFKPGLYRAGDDITLPYGTRISGGGEIQAPWHGTVEMGADGVLTVNAMTRAKDVAIYFPGSVRVAESVILGGMAQYLQDPNVQVLQIYLGALAFVIAVGGLLLSGPKPPDSTGKDSDAPR